jgi:hypothetical protein
MEGDDPFSAYHHPAQPWALDVHVLGAPLLVFAVGWFFGTHVLPKLQGGGPRARRSGVVLLAIAAAMTVSGYLLQTVADDTVRVATAWVHGVTGTLFAALLVGHLASGRRGPPRR